MMTMGMNSSKGKTVWIDMDNSPHVHFFRPIIKELTKRGYRVVVTVRECFQVCDLADRFDIPYRRIGRHYGGNKMMKVMGLVIRSMELLPFAAKERPAIAISHGSRAQILSAKMLGIPSVLIEDYEYAKGLQILNPTWSIAPEVIHDDVFKNTKKDRVLKYPGIKEDVYVADFRPQKGIREELKIKETDILATIRPPAIEANYHNPEGLALFEAAVDYLSGFTQAKMVVLPRARSDRKIVTGRWPGLISSGRIIIPDKAVDGLNLIWHSDLIISGGGTMNREAAALGVPVYSIFRGRLGAVDRHLAETGKLILVGNMEELKARIKISSWQRPESPPAIKKVSLEAIVESLESIINKSIRGRRGVKDEDNDSRRRETQFHEGRADHKGDRRLQ